MQVWHRLLASPPHIGGVRFSLLSCPTALAGKAMGSLPCPSVAVQGWL